MLIRLRARRFSPRGRRGGGEGRRGDIDNDQPTGCSSDVDKLSKYLKIVPQRFAPSLSSEDNFSVRVSRGMEGGRETTSTTARVFLGRLVREGGETNDFVPINSKLRVTTWSTAVIPLPRISAQAG